MAQTSGQNVLRAVEALRRALEEVPAYRPWRRLDPGAALPVAQRYAALPATGKKLLRENFPDGLLVAGRDLRHGLATGEVSLAHTSGTTQERLTTVWDQAWWNASERLSWGWNTAAAAAGLGGHREALLASPRSVGVPCAGGCLPMERRREGRFLFLNEKLDPSAWTPQHVDRMIDELGVFRPVVLEANPSFLARLCRSAADRGRSVPAPELIVVTFEFTSRLHLGQIRRVFPHTPAFSSYGSTETGYVTVECEHGSHHHNAGSCRIDFQPLRAEFGGRRTGRILVTPFGHRWMQVLRFDIGDVFRYEPAFRCPCGRNGGLVFRRLEGRVRDITFTPGGRAVTVDALDAALAEVPGLFTYRLRQTAPAQYRLHAVPLRQGDADVAPAAAAALAAVYGPAASVEVEVGPDLPPEPSGKYRLAGLAYGFDYGRLFDGDLPVGEGDDG